MKFNTLGTEPHSVNFHVSLFLLFLGWASTIFLTASTLSAQEGDDSRAPLPPFAKQLEAARLLEETQDIGNLDTTTKKKQALKKLMDLVQDGKLTDGEMYVVLTKSIPLAREVDDITTLTEALKLLTESYRVDSLREQIQTWTSYLEGCSSKTPFKATIDAIIDVAGQAIQEHRYSEAIGLLKVAEATATRLDVVASLKQSIHKELVALTTREKTWKMFQSATETLKSEPDDPAASQIAGRWYAIEEQNWDRAIPLLANAKDPQWKGAAVLDRGSPTDSTKQQAVADAWWDLAATETGITKAVLTQRAGEWYEKALAGTPSSLKKQVLNNRLAEIATLNASLASTLPAGKAVLSQPKLIQKPGEWIDLLAWAESADWSQRGHDWNQQLERKPTKSGITLNSNRFNRYPLPAIIDGDYEMEVEFVRSSGREAVAVFFPIGIHTVQLEVGGYTGSKAFVAFINGRTYGEQSPCPISQNVRHHIVIRTHRDGDKASFQIDWDENKNYITWEGPYSALTHLASASDWKLTLTRHPWVGSWGNIVTFQEVKVRMLTGEIKPDFITQADRDADSRSGLVRLAWQTANAKKVGWASFFVSQIPFIAPRGDYERFWPMIAPEFKICQDFYAAHAPSRIKCEIPQNAKSFSVIGYNDASRTTRFSALVDGVEVYNSGVTDVAIIKLDLKSDAKLLELIIDPVEDQHFDHSFWCYPRYHNVTQDKLTDKMLEGKPNSSLKFTISTGTVGANQLTHNRVAKGLRSVPLALGDRIPCDEFLFSHAPSTVSYAVPDGMTRFTAIGYNVLSNHVKYEVWADANRIYESQQAGIVPIDVKLPKGTKTIELKVNDLRDGRNDISIWCYPRLHRK